MLGFLVQPNRSPIPCFPTRRFQSPWVLQQKYGLWLALCSGSWWEMSGQELKG